jgi:hypothetical protein
MTRTDRISGGIVALVVQLPANRTCPFETVFWSFMPVFKKGDRAKKGKVLIKEC